MLEMRSYRSEDEEEWLKCRALTYLCSNERRSLNKKPRYTRQCVELVATDNDRIIGFLDIELEDAPGSICYKKVEGNAMLWDIGIIKEYRRKNFGTRILQEGIKQAKNHGIKRLEAWTIEDGAKSFYEKSGFQKFYEYHHVLIESREKLRPIDRDGMHIVEAYAHIMPDTDIESFKRKYEPEQIHVCSGFEFSV